MSIKHSAFHPMISWAFGLPAIAIIFSIQHLISSKFRCLCASIIPFVDTFLILLDICCGRGEGCFCWNQFHEKFQMDQVAIGARMNPTRRTVSKKVVHWSTSCTISRTSTASAHHNSIFLCLSLDVRDCLVGLDGQSVRDGLAAVEISRSSFRRFFFWKLLRLFWQKLNLWNITRQGTNNNVSFFKKKTVELTISVSPPPSPPWKSWTSQSTQQPDTFF